MHGKVYLVALMGLGKTRSYENKRSWPSAKKEARDWYEVFARDEVHAIQLAMVRDSLEDIGVEGKTYGIIDKRDNHRDKKFVVQPVNMGAMSKPTSKQKIDLNNPKTYVECRVPDCDYKGKCLTNHLNKTHKLKGKEYQSMYGGEVFSQDLLDSMRKDGAKGADNPVNEIVQKIRRLSREQRTAVINFIDAIIDRGDWREEYAKIAEGREGL